MLEKNSVEKAEEAIFKKFALDKTCYLYNCFPRSMQVYFVGQEYVEEEEIKSDLYLVEKFKK